MSNVDVKVSISPHRKLVVRILLSLSHWFGILEFMDFIDCVEAEEKKITKMKISKSKELWEIKG